MEFFRTVIQRKDLINTIIPFYSLPLKVIQLLSDNSVFKTKGLGYGYLNCEAIFEVNAADCN